MLYEMQKIMRLNEIILIQKCGNLFKFQPFIRRSLSELKRWKGHFFILQAIRLKSKVSSDVSLPLSIR